MIISILEIIYLFITTLIIAYIFMGIVRKDPLDALQRYKFNWNDFKFAAIVAAPGIIVHELAHKFVAMAFGLEATFQIFPLGLAIGVILKLVGSGFILLAPGYVAIGGSVTPLAMFLTAAAGPLTNLIFWLGGKYYVDRNKNLTRNWALGLIMFSQINKWLFIFNMIPIPPLDGSKVLMGLFQLFF